MSGRFRPILLVSASTRRLLFVLLILVFLVIAFLPRQAQKILQSFGEPVTDLLAWPIGALAAVDRGIRNTWNRYIALQGVYEQNRQLREEIQRLEGKVNQLREKAEASDRLAEILDFQTETPIETVAARVIGRDTSNWYQALVVNKGTHDGVEVEMGVITPGGVVGQVIKAASGTSLILLLTDPNIAVPGLVQRTRDEGIVQGAAQGLVRMKYIPPLSQIQSGDVIVTSGLTGGFPRGLVIGEVQDTEEGPGELFQSAAIRPMVDFTKLEEVLIITAAQPQEVHNLLNEPLSPSSNAESREP